MKKNCIDKLFICAAVSFIIASCSDKTNHGEHVTHESHIDTSLIAVAQPVNSDNIIASVSVVEPEQGKKIFSREINGAVTYDTRKQVSVSSRVAGRIEKLHVKYNYQPVKQGTLILEIYSPDLAAAQQEMLFLQNSGEKELLDKAKQRLVLLGMRETDINGVLQSGKVQHRVPVYSNADGIIVEQGTDPVMQEGANQSLAIREGQYVAAGQPLFTLFDTRSVVAEFAIEPSQAAGIQRGKSLLFHKQGDRENMISGTVGFIEPTLRSNQTFHIVRVYIKRNDFRVGDLLTAHIPVEFSEGWWLPQKAILNTGNYALVFRKDQSGFKPVRISLTTVINGQALISTDIGGWKVAANAAFLADSEAFIDPVKTPGDE